MKLSTDIKRMLLAASDVAIFYAALLLTFVIRYGSAFWTNFVDSHLVPFTIILLIWTTIFYIAGLYNITRLRNSLAFIKTLESTIALNSVLAVTFFYLVPTFGIAPKTNLFIFITIYALAQLWWRRLFNRLVASGQKAVRVLLFGDGAVADEVAAALDENPQIGFKIVRRMTAQIPLSSRQLQEIIAERDIDLIVIPRHLKNDATATKFLYSLFAAGREIRELPYFYEQIFRAIPISEIEDSWFFENVLERQKPYDQFKWAGEVLGTMLLAIVVSPFLLVIAFLVKITSRGPVFIRQKRVGRDGKTFTLYKFRSMVALSPDGHAELNGAQWSQKNDRRVTPFGRFLRYSHLDEFPQLVNILKGELSFVGPRPERPEIVEVLKTKVPHYLIRHIVTPGVTGWAQINYRKDETTEDVARKIQYDLYYLKNRSLILDFTIVIKTLKLFFVNHT